MSNETVPLMPTLRNELAIFLRALAASVRLLGAQRDGVGLSHDDMCMLSRCFNSATASLGVDQYRRINDWLGECIRASGNSDQAQPPENQ